MALWITKPSDEEFITDSNSVVTDAVHVEA